MRFCGMYLAHMKNRVKKPRFLDACNFYLKKVFWHYLLIGARYKSKKSHFEINVKLRIFYTHVDLFEETKMLLMTFSLFWPLKTHFCTGRRENKEKRLLYFGLEFFCQSKFSFRKLKIQIIQKSSSPILQPRN
jgi:hypothetical protein